MGIPEWKYMHIVHIEHDAIQRVYPVPDIVKSYFKSMLH